MDHNSTSAMETKTIVSRFIRKLYTCPECSVYFQPPILQCCYGHLICSKCRSKETCCRRCREPLGNIRNLAMEEYASAHMFPCKYSQPGCAVALLYTERREHEEACEFRPYPCPFQGPFCKWQGCNNKVIPHTMKSHNSVEILQGEYVVFSATHINQPGAGNWVKMQTCFGHHFRLLLLNRGELNEREKFLFTVHLIGSREQAGKFAYTLQVKKRREHLTWEATPKSILEPYFKIIMKPDCLRFDACTARLLARKGTLRIHVSIRMV
ncbi:E3 ubiquitin-protein ligase SIAH1 [Cryptotermes secundus]|uniref:E3 ubiquitin-protein ligase n=1 Tax=Cryptotermes secundus TaxID=105785 RepID=A0A2J7Q9H3_9NEOP|nr:E3 ubiquitin-protein ligase SIAH1A [Cryptotermes secundus]PNF25243.1 E3 ubiquitin-protein ligase SIAH1 [Cryptotermes secundus]